jgi:hypothetical protein
MPDHQQQQQQQRSTTTAATGPPPMPDMLPAAVAMPPRMHVELSQADKADRFSALR